MKLHTSMFWGTLAIHSAQLFLPWGWKPSALAESNPPTNSCETLSLNQPPPELTDFLPQLEGALFAADYPQLQSMLHPSLILDELESSAIFKEMNSSYEIKGKKLIRNSAYKLGLRSDSQTVRCKDHQVKGVVGPDTQWAIEYSTTANSEQARLFFLIAPVPPALQKKSKHTVGLVHINTQNWTFKSQTPTSLLKKATHWQNLDAPLAAWAYLEAATRIVESNPYFLKLDLAETIKSMQQLKEKADALTQPFKGRAIAKTELKIEDFTVVFKDSGPQIGVKLRARSALSVNEQIEQCRTMATELAPLFKDIRQEFQGIECLLYGGSEDLMGPPQAGSIFQNISEALKKP